MNSYHHQSVKDLPDGFITTFVNQDVIEAIEHQTLPLIGIQWHPERFYTNESKIIFDYFFDLIKEYKNSIEQSCPILFFLIIFFIFCNNFIN
ncbi:MAG: gamma-glutamyl-gamma-aminobutyrate hydrolase family protein [Bacilli bacterium]